MGFAIVSILLIAVIILWLFRKRIALELYKIYLHRKYKIRAEARSFADLYNRLWKSHPSVLIKERKTLLKLIALMG
jgi:hypothetical protein